MSSIPGKPDDDHLETAALYALQVLSGNEISVFEDHLSTCAECLREIETLRPMIGSLASWPTDILRPPASLWKRLSQRIADESCTEPISPPARVPAKPEWEEVASGIFCKVLAVDLETSRVTMLVRLAPGTDYPPHRHAGVEELHLLHGELMIDGKKLSAGEFIRAEAGSVDHRVWSDTGCTCLLVTSTRDAILS
jgi:quercetin dioxygenase-like cupin family protein